MGPWGRRAAGSQQLAEVATEPGGYSSLQPGKIEFGLIAWFLKQVSKLLCKSEISVTKIHS